MKTPLEEFQSSSSSDSSTNNPAIMVKNDQELGYTSGNGNVSERKYFCNLPRKLDVTLVRKIMAEAVGTFILMFCISGIIGNMQLMGVEKGLMEYAVTAGLTVVIIVFSIGSISGAHVNPAVTIAFAAVGPFPWSNVPLYVLAQVGGSVLATYAGNLIYGIKPEVMITMPLHGRTSAFWVELIATFLILFLTTSLLSQKPQSSVGQIAGFVAGVAISLGVLISGPISGGSMNPARSLGPAIVSWKFSSLWIYIVAPTLGAIAGVFMGRILRLEGWACKTLVPQNSLQVNHSSSE